MANSKSIGRPAKISLEEKKSLVLRYFVEMSECNTKVMREKNIYKQLSNFAKQSGYNLESYDFYRSEKNKSYIYELSNQNQIDTNPQENWVFQSLDIDYICRPDITVDIKRKFLVKQDSYYHKMYNQAITSLNSVKSLDNTITILLDKNKKLEKQNCEILEKNMNLENNLKLALSKNQYLKEFIKKHYGPDIASAIVSKEDSRLSPIEAATATFDELISNDNALQSKSPIYKEVVESSLTLLE